MTVWTTIDSPLGELLLVGEESATARGGTALVSLSMPGQKSGAVVRDGWTRDDAAFADIAAQLNSFFEGGLTDFAVEYSGGAGTHFQRRVWKAVEGVPHGTTVSYGEIAARIGASRAAVRAVGTAIGANPVLVVRPCHRVIGSGGALAGYAAGPERRRRLLDLENTRPSG